MQLVVIWMVLVRGPAQPSKGEDLHVAKLGTGNWVQRSLAQLHQGTGEIVLMTQELDMQLRGPARAHVPRKYEGLAAENNT